MSSALTLNLYLVFLFIVSPLTNGVFYPFKPELRIQGLCKGDCETNLSYINEGGSDLFCDKDCSVQQCQKGCSMYKSAIHGSCQKVCITLNQETVSAIDYQSQDEMRNCIQGCFFGLDEYANPLMDYLSGERWGVLFKPTLVRSSLNYSSLTLKWDTPVIENVTYKVHKRLVDMDSGWHLHADTNFRKDRKIELTNLHPFVTYKFKVLAIVSSRPTHIMESSATVEIMTLPYGAPSTAPKITSLTTPSPRVISLAWTPPLFANGKLLSYRIYVQAVNHPLLNLTTIEVPGNATSWFLSQLQSSQKYVISLSAWNAEGEGPKGSRTIMTPNPGNLSAHEAPYLILGVANKIVKRNILDVIQYAGQLSDPVYSHPNPNVTVRDISLHVRRHLILATDSDDSVTVISLKGDPPKRNHYPSILDPGAIAVDWLADRVYVASRDRIYSCPLEKDLCVVAIQGLERPASDIKVDPINGYLFYVINGAGHGLYRINLGAISHLWDTTSPPSSSSFSSVTSGRAELIVPMSDLFTHAIDFYNVHLYLVNNTARTMMTAFLDGSNMRPFHEKTISSAFSGVTSMVFYNQTFIWTNKAKMYVEEYERPTQNIRHNELLFFTPPYTGISIFHPSAQPLPTPSTAPESVEALFVKDRAVIRWKTPVLLQYQGIGAWKNWSYELQLARSDENGMMLEEPKDYSIADMSLTVPDLDPDTLYAVKVRAKSGSGYGPWSTSFVGRTLKEDGLSVLMGVAGGKIIQKDLSTGNHKNVVNFFSNAADIDWHDDIVLWVTHAGILSVYNRTSQQKRHLAATKEAYCLAFDWLGHKVYWSEPDGGVIRRSDIHGITSEFIRRATARDIALDSVAGRLYWATQHSIDTSYLNGDEHQEIFTMPYFSGRHVISLTLDFDMKKVLWYVKGYDTQSVFMADLISPDNAGQIGASWERLGDFKNIASTSALRYFSQRLFWLTERNTLVVGDSQCNYTSAVSFYSNLTSFSVVHPSMHAYPAGVTKDNLRVIPDPIRSEDIKTVGKWFSFNLTWPRSTEVTHGTVFYKVFVEVGQDNKHFTTSRQWTDMSGLSPYTQIVVSIQPYTYWGYADPTTVSVRSPMSTPTVPLSPEVYVIQHKNATASHQSLAADFRWMTPNLTNGIISYHQVTHWMGDGTGSEVTVVRVKGSARHFILTPLVKSQTYHFKVAACTDAGCSPETPTRTAVTDALNPIPTLLVASRKGLTLTEMDRRPNSTVVLSDIKPEAVTFLAQEEPRMFWLDMRNKVYENSGSPFHELVDLNGTGKDLTIDWISRTLYTVESVGKQESNIMQFNIDRGGYKMFLSRLAQIGSIVTDPYNSAIMWTENTSEGQGQVMVADIRTQQVEVVIGPDSRSRRSSGKPQCSCSQALDVSPVIGTDYKRHDGATEIIFADKNTGALYSSDINGCQCSLIFQPTPSKKFGLPPSLLAVDHMRVSWYNKTEGKLYSVSKATGQGLIVQDVGDIQDIIAYGSHLQPLPDSQCLDPGAYNSTVENIYIDSTVIHLRLSAPIRPPACQEISSPQDKFTIYYRKVKILKTGAAPEDCRANPSACEKQESYTTFVMLKNLAPYTQYLIQVAVSNYYTEYLSEAMSEPLLLTTKFGIPEAARDVVASPYTPEKITVQWLPPLRFNGPPEMVSYVVQFSTFTSEGHIQRETENVIGTHHTEGWIQTVLKDLKSDHIYNIKVQTCTANRTMCNGTDIVEARTFKTPSNITFVSATPHSVEILWRSPSDNSILRHQVIYAEVKPGSLVWHQKEDFPGTTENYSEYREEVNGLKPNTLYAFRIKANYRARPYDGALYVWPPMATMFTHRTLVFHPDQPPPPTVTHLKTGSYEVRWEEPENNGAPIKNYMLEYKNVEKGTWKTAYNGSVERWLIETSKLERGKSYIFRVAAINSQGMGPFSTNSSRFLAAFAVENSLSDQVTIGIIVGVLLLVALIIIAIVLVLRKRHEKIKTQQFIIRGPDTELATLRELPHTTFQQSNTLYAINIQCTDEEIAKLPHFSRNQLVLTMFLGSGAFGEVFEGLAKNILGDSTGETKCAVKTLRKSASDHEKEEFLKEALLMKNFQHEHILSLLGVCLDNDPQFIIMELMEGGDLLSFLRSCRATSTMPARLLLPDLVRICVNVARGCKYLEDMHFVHRDLAARNCLVSSKSTSDMVVKIGDFGLARDIYKNDYYRKEGEGLLPVRWMSPESLVDGFFTTQSDIWAFGVLMWEVVTLGQQPYPARTNIEVLHFVRDRGKLERPDKCADEIYALMSKCWSFLPDNRPSFASLLEHLEMFQEKCCHMTPEEIAQFSPSVMDVSTCMSPHPPCHQNNKHRPLPQIPSSLLDPAIFSPNQFYYSHPWDVPAPYSKPWDPSSLTPGGSATADSNFEQNSGSVPDKIYSATSSLYLLPLSDLEAHRHDYCLPDGSGKLTNNSQRANIFRQDETSRALGETATYCETSGFGLRSSDFDLDEPYYILSSNLSSQANSHQPIVRSEVLRSSGSSRESTLLIKSRKNKRKRARLRNPMNRSGKNNTNMENMACPMCITEAARSLSDSVPYVSVKTPVPNAEHDENCNHVKESPPQLHVYETMSSCVTCTAERNGKSFPPVYYSIADDRSLKNLAILRASRKKVGLGGNTDNPERCSPDEGIWSPSMSSQRKLISARPISSIFHSDSNSVPVTSVCHRQRKRRSIKSKVPRAFKSNPKMKRKISKQNSCSKLLSSSGSKSSPVPTCYPNGRDHVHTHSPSAENIGCMGRTGKHVSEGHTNIAFIDEAAHSDVVESMSEEEEEEETEEQAVTRGLFTPNSRTITGGGSVRLTQSGKQKRLNDLLGSHDTPQKLVVDLTNIGRKRTHSLEDSKHSQYSQAGAHRDHFPAAGEYDHNGYLEPRGSKGGGRYLELMNYAPELRYLRDPHGNPLVTAGSAFTPVHVTRKGYHPSSISYTLLSHEEDAEDAHCQNGTYHPNGNNICAVDDPNYFMHSAPRDAAGHPYGLVSVEESPVYSQVRDDRRHYSSDSSGRQLGDYSYYPQSSRSPPAVMMMKAPPQRKYSDQDLYSSTAPYRQRRPSSSSSSQDHRYASVECNNNRNSASNSNFSAGQGYICDTVNGSNGSPRNRHGSGGSFHPYAKPGLGYTVNGGMPVAEDGNSKLSSSRDTWASNLDDVFFDNDTMSECSTQRGAEFINYQGQGHHSSRSRGQVYPENNTALVGYETAQVSLV